MQAPPTADETAEVSSIIKDYRDGKIVVPEFQRDYVWPPSRAAKLLDSLYRGYPISSLLLWESDEKVESRRSEPQPAFTGALGWLIDRQQRVLTLSRCRAGDESLDISFNLDKEIFSRSNAATRKNPRCVSMSQLWDEDLWRQWRRDRPDNQQGRMDEERCEAVRAILSYKIPIVRMVDYDFDAAVESFTRINQLGVRLRAQDIESARIAQRHTGFIRKQLVPFLRQLHERGYDRLTAIHMFRVCAFVAHPDGRNRTPLHELSQSEVADAWKKTVRAVEEGIGLVEAGLGTAGMSVLWSGSLLVPVFALCAALPARQRNDREIAGWGAAATLRHRYSVSSATALEQDLRACHSPDPIRQLLSNLRDGRRLRAVAKHFDASLADRGALLMLFIACHQLGARSLFSKGSIDHQRALERHHLLARSHFHTPAERQRADNVANIAFVLRGDNRAISDHHPVQYFSEITAKVRASQAVPADERLWDFAKAEDFWAHRAVLLAGSFNEFLRNAFDRRNGIG